MNDHTSRITLVSQVDQLSVTGVVDSHTAPQLDEAINAYGRNRDVHLDLSAVDFIDSSGLRVVVNAHRELEAAGHRLVLTQASDTVTRLLEITGLTDHLHRL